MRAMPEQGACLPQKKNKPAWQMTYCIDLLSGEAQKWRRNRVRRPPCGSGEENGGGIAAVKPLQRLGSPRGSRGVGDWHEHLFPLRRILSLGMFLKHTPEQSCRGRSPSRRVTGCRSKIHAESGGNMVQSCPSLAAASSCPAVKCPKHHHLYTIPFEGKVLARSLANHCKLHNGRTSMCPDEGTRKLVAA